MAIRSLATYLASAFLATAVLAQDDGSPLPTCRYIFGDKGWPTQADWAYLNTTLSGRLIATVPMAHVCHDPTVNTPACNALKTPTIFPGPPPEYATRRHLNLTTWDNSATYISQPAEIQDPYYQNQTCDPFTPASKPCVLGNLASYSINVTGADDVIAGMQFATEKNVRLTIRNTGHDYNGKSSGLGSLSLWMHNLKTMDIIPQYTSSVYSGPAVKLGAGVNAGDALVHVSQSGYRLVTGECGTVGISGGYSQGGGHGPLNSAYGLAADNTLEFEVVTAEGKFLIASPQQNANIYWALSGGGGGTYGVVLSMTSRIHPDGPIIAPILTFTSPNVGNATYWKAIGVFHKHIPEIVKGNNHSVQYNIENNSFGAIFIFLDQDTTAVNRTLGPLFAELNTVGIPYSFLVQQMPSYVDYYNAFYGPLPYGLEPPSTSLNSRIIPKSVVLDPAANKKLMDAFAFTSQSGEFQITCTAADFTSTSHPDNAVLPAWRPSIGGCNMVVFWNWTAPLASNLEKKARMVNLYAPAWDAATPGSGVYLNEIDPWYKGDFKQTMYGSNYDRLLQIKHKYDPHHLMYGFHAVGSDEFTTDGSGRLCYHGP